MFSLLGSELGEEDVKCLTGLDSLSITLQFRQMKMEFRVPEADMDQACRMKARP